MNHHSPAGMGSASTTAALPSGGPFTPSQLTSSSANSMWINKLKIVGSGQNWAVAPCEPFYLMGTDPPAPDAALTGARNLIEHYGLANAYQKFCSRPLREELSAFLPHLAGNVDVPASSDGSGLMALIEQPPIRGKELRTFAPSQLDQAFRLHPGPLPQEYTSLFAVSSSSKSRSYSAHGSQDAATSNSAALRTTAYGSRLPPASSTPGFSSFSRRRRRYDVSRGVGAMSSSGGGGSSLNLGGPCLAGSFVQNPSTSAVPSSSSQIQTLPVTSNTHLPHPSSSIDPSITLSSRLAGEQPPGLIPVTSPASLSTSDHSQPSQHQSSQPPPPPPLLAPVHQFSSTTSQRPVSGGSLSSEPTPPNPGLPAPPLLQSIHSNPISTRPSVHPQALQQQFHNDPSKFSSSFPVTSPSSPIDYQKSRLLAVDGLDEERKKKKRKEKKRRKERD